MSCRTTSCVQELTGDSDIPDFNTLNTVDIIYTTPEKLDSLTRRKKDQGSMSFYSDIALLLIAQDVHLLSDAVGSAEYNSQMKSICSTMTGEPLWRHWWQDCTPLAKIRIAAISATIP
eukprot:8317407-Pyramimonas_sp.AAC.1